MKVYLLRYTTLSLNIIEMISEIYRNDMIDEYYNKSLDICKYSSSFFNEFTNNSLYIGNKIYRIPKMVVIFTLIKYD